MAGVATTNDTFGSREKWPLQNGWVGGRQKVRSLAAPQRGGNKWGCAATAQHVWGSAGASGRGARPVSNQPKSGQPPGAIPARGVLSRGCAACGAGAGAAPAQRRPSGGSSSFQAGEVSSAAVQISQKTISKIQLNSYERRKTYLTYFCPRARGFESRSSDFLFAIFARAVGQIAALRACTDQQQQLEHFETAWILAGTAAKNRCNADCSSVAAIDPINSCLLAIGAGCALAGRRHKSTGMTMRAS